MWDDSFLLKATLISFSGDLYRLNISQRYPIHVCLTFLPALSQTSFVILDRGLKLGLHNQSRVILKLEYHSVHFLTLWHFFCILMTCKQFAPLSNMKITTAYGKCVTDLEATVKSRQ